jgi:hypothetical protein
MAIPFPWQSWQVAAIILAVATPLTSPRPAMACVCPPTEPAIRVKRASAIFAGEVASVEQRVAMPGGTNTATILVSETWKGGTDGQSRVVAPLPTGGNCAFTFRAGQRVVVFATRQAADGIWSVGGCDVLPHPLQSQALASEVARARR